MAARKGDYRTVRSDNALLWNLLGRDSKRVYDVMCSVFAQAMHDTEEFVRDRQYEDLGSGSKGRLRNYMLQRAREHAVSSLKEGLGTPETVQICTSGALLQSVLSDILESLDQAVEE